MLHNGGKYYVNGSSPCDHVAIPQHHNKYKYIIINKINNNTKYVLYLALY